MAGNGLPKGWRNFCKLFPDCSSLSSFTLMSIEMKRVFCFPRLSLLGANSRSPITLKSSSILDFSSLFYLELFNGKLWLKTYNVVIKCNHSLTSLQGCQISILMFHGWVKRTFDKIAGCVETISTFKNVAKIIPWM